MPNWLKKADTYNEYSRETFMQKLKQDKESLLNEMADWIYSGMFGDGQEMEYVRGGIKFKGLDNMTDEELLAEAVSSGLIIEE